VKKIDVKLKTIRSIFFCLIFGYLLKKHGEYYLGGSLFVQYFVPFFVFQFWLSTFTYFHHRHKDAAGWKKDENWDKVYGGLYATVHVDFPAWIEFLTLDINWHLPHHASVMVPWYNLRPATYNLLKNMVMFYKLMFFLGNYGRKQQQDVICIPRMDSAHFQICKYQ